MKSAAYLRGLACTALVLMASRAAAESPANAERHDMQLVGYHDLQGRSAYQPVIQRQGTRWIAYIGHHGGRERNDLTRADEDSGTSILDVTDPKQPKLLSHIPGEAGAAEGGGAQMVRVCDGATLPRADKQKVYLLRTFGNSAHEVWDVTDPARPSRVSTVVNGLHGTHKNWWECDTGIAYLVSGDPAWRVRRMTKIYDLSDPAHPVFIRDFGLVGQQPGATGEVPTELHGPISLGPKGNRVYFGYGAGRGGILQIVDRETLLKGAAVPTPENLRSPEIGRLELPPNLGAHTTFPLLQVKIPEFSHDQDNVRDFVVITNESLTDGCQEGRQMVWIADVTVESKPFTVANWTVPEASGHFCSRGGRFGTHSSNESFAPVYHRRLMFFAHFNAGVRAVDVRDPYHPKEVAYYIPATTERTAKRCGASGCKAVIQTNNVEVDERGYIYIVDRAGTGLHILELTGEARKIAQMP
ncbi:MAG: LVIVD repeat-containing protein [Sulfurifustis sp.]